MNNNTITAKDLFYKEGCTCVICKGMDIYKSHESGVNPLLDVIDKKLDFKKACAADKVVGRAAAFLYIIIGIEELYAEVISERACAILKEHGVKVYYSECIKQIMNRQNTGICPMEDAVLNISESFAAETAIRQRREELKKRLVK